MKKKNQTCQTLVSAPKIHPEPVSERTEGKIDSFLIVLSAVTQASPGKTSGSEL